MRKIAIIGSGDLGSQLKHLAAQCKGNKVIGFFDDYAKIGEHKHGLPVFGGSDDVLHHFELKLFDALLIGIGYNHMSVRRNLYDRFSSYIPFASLMHPSAIIDDSVEIGNGTIIYAGCILDVGVKIGDNVLVNVGGIVAHDTTIGNHCFLSPAVSIAGFVSIGSSSVIGINSTLIDNLNLPSGTQIGGGAVVIRSPEKPGLYVGNPARYIRPTEHI